MEDNLLAEAAKDLDLPLRCLQILRNSLFKGILLAYWDNIMGPQVRRLWLGTSNTWMSQDILNYVSSHTLNGELFRHREEGNIDNKFYVQKDRGFIFSSYIFTGLIKLGPTVYSLSLIMDFSDLQQFLNLQLYINNQLRVLVTKYRVLQEKNLSAAAEKFTRHLQEFTETVDSLIVSGLPPAICFKDTVFSSVDCHGLNDHKFLMRAITSHLQTCGCSVVVGCDKAAVTLMVNTLGTFLTDKERACSRKALEQYNHNRDVFVQGLLKSDPGNTMRWSSKDVLLSTYPTTLIDVDTKDVMQTYNILEHTMTRLEFLKLELNLLLKGEEAPVYPSRGLFRESDDIAIMVQHYVSEMFALPLLCSVRETYSDNFAFILKQKARSLLSYVEARSLRGVDYISRNTFIRLQQDLSLTSEADFRIVLAWAEKLRPGMGNFLMMGEFRNEEEHYKVDAVQVTPMWK